jgi:hypothetical protein
MRPILAGVSRHAGHKRIFLGVVAALVTAALVAPALAGDNGAQKVDLRDLASRGGCDLPDIPPGGDDKSSAIFNRSPDGFEVRVTLQLQDALPNTTYRVNLWMNRCTSGVLGIPVRTNNQGNRTEQIEGRPGGDPEPMVSDASVEVLTEPPASPDIKQTPTVTFGP